MTDGSASVLSLTDCNAGDGSPYVFHKPGNLVTRLVRRMILESRNHVERENVYYWTFQAAKSARNRIFQSSNQAKSDN